MIKYGDYHILLLEVTSIYFPKQNEELYSFLPLMPKLEMTTLHFNKVTSEL